MRFGLLSTYPPTPCGLATFTRALGDALGTLSGCSVFVVRSVEAVDGASPDDVVHHLVAGDRLSQRRSAEALNAGDVAIVQHEYGIYGGSDGDELLSVLAGITIPLIVVLHTVLSRPSVRQRRVLEAVCSAANAVVVMSEAARSRLALTYRVDHSKLVVIPHGVAPSIARHRKVATSHRILTWGLIGRGKGIEWGIHALARLRDLDPAPEYLVAGQTHPRVLEAEGEAYRDSLRALAQDIGVGHLLRFDASYRPVESMPELIGSAEVVLLPYDNDEQVTSGVLIEAVSAGRPVVATRFPHAVELLAGGAGIVVDHGDVDAMSDGIRAILTEPGRATSMSQVARAEAGRMLWPSVAREYAMLAGRLLSATHRSVAGHDAVDQRRPLRTATR